MINYMTQAIIQNLFTFSVFLVICSAILDIIANVLLAKSNGFTNKKLGFLALVLVGFAFWLLSIAVQKIDLTVAYALWGCFGILGTSLMGWLILGQKMHSTAFLGIALLMCGIVFLKL